MNRSLEVVKKIYKPYRYTIKGKTTVLETTSGNFIVKEKNNDIKSIYNYLLSRNFDYFPKLIDESRKDVNVFESIEDTLMPKEQRIEDLIEVVSLLHNKTSYHKEVTEDNYKEIYENIKSNIDYAREYYNKLYDTYMLEVYMAPSHYSLMRSISKVLSALDFCDNELNEWYDIVKEETKQRVALIHNNLEVDHFLRNDKSYLISWDYAKIDTPVLDLVKLYKKEYFNYNFDSIIKRYFSKYPLNESEQKLFFILISLPPVINLDALEFENCSRVREMLDYVFKTEILVRPYYTKDEEK